MGFPLDLALRYMRSKKRSFVSVGTVFAVLGVALGVAALATVVSVTGGFRKQFRDKVLGVNAHVLVLKYTSDFREYRRIMKQLASVQGVVGIAPFVINPMMITHGDRTATGVFLFAGNTGAGHALPTYITPRIRLRIASTATGRAAEHVIQRSMAWSTESGWEELADTRLLPSEWATLY